LDVTRRRTVRQYGRAVDRRLLLVHAHPDDETIGTGATMAKYAAGGAQVVLVTCTLGEEGEILTDDLAHLAADRDDRLGVHRIGELTAACAALGVRDVRLLGGPGRWRDSGMAGTEPNSRPEAFVNAAEDEVVAELVAIVRDVRPQVVITYDENGGYGHPDHIRAHQVTVAAFDAAADPGFHPDRGEPWRADKLYYTALPKSVLQQAIDYFRDRGEGTSFFPPDVTDATHLPMGTPDELVTTRIDAPEFFDAKMAAMRAHRSQIAVDGPFFALADNVGQQAFGVEYYVLARGARGPGDPWETDLFAEPSAGT
jgi:N-acetyl-1-D-myo-inositol-2-amino-2-deoxy-alpha-D-glucopyranoside deacetylase